MAFQIGDTVGDYEIVGLLGAGGMGRVYKARHRISDRLEALKVVLPERQNDPDLEARFEREIKVHASLNHPNIAALHTAVWVNGCLLMVIEFVEGVSLAEKLIFGAVSIPDGLAYVGAVLRALAYAHSHGVIHRDVKPANIMITPEGMVKLTDFGIARALRQGTLTRSGLAIGSLNYMSPEQIRGAPVDARSDVYSVGVTLYEALTRQRPIRGDSEHAIMQAQIEQEPVAPSVLIHGFPAVLSQIIMKSLAKDPAARFQTADEFRIALELSSGLAAGGSTVQAIVSTTIDAATLSKIEKCLAAVVGPVARPLVSRAARQAAGVGDLCANLSEQIPTEAERKKFLRCCETQTGEAPALTAKTAVKTTTKVTTRREFTPDFLDHAKRELAAHIGPLAKILVEKTAKKVRTPLELIEALGQEIPDARNREKFMAVLRRHVG